MNFDRIAPHYPWMERIFAGDLMQRCRTTFLADTKNCRRALVVGEGPGIFLTELLRHNPGIQVVCVEHSPGMIEQARRRLARNHLDPARVEFRQMNALDWKPPEEKFDLIVTHFFLDCFPAPQLASLVDLLAASATPDAKWLLTDFRLPERGWRRWRAYTLLTVLYTFFKIATALPARWLTPPDSFLAAAGFNLMDRRLANFGFAHADLWWRTASAPPLPI